MFKTNWQEVHERLMDNMKLIAGKPVRDLEKDIAHLDKYDQPAVRWKNDCNSNAVDRYMEESAKEAKKWRGR